MLGREQTRAGLAEAESFIPAGLHLAHQEQTETNEEKEREAVEEKQNPIAAADLLDFDLHGFVAQGLGDVRGIFFGNSDLKLAVGGPDVFPLEIIAELPEVYG